LLIACLTLLDTVPRDAFPAAASAQTPQQRERELKQLRQRIHQLQARIRSTRGRQSRLNRELQASEEQIGRVARHLRVLKGRLRRQNARLADLSARERQQQQALARQRALLARQIRSAYATGRQEQLEILLNQQDPAELSRLLTYYDYLNRARARQMARIRKSLRALDDTRREIREEQARLARLESEQQQQKLALEQQQQARREVLRQLASQIQGQDARLGQLRKDEKQLQQLLRGLQDALADIPRNLEAQQPFAKVRGRLPWPLRGVIRHAFGDPKIGALRWDGVMIEAPEGREVHAVHAGRVAFADWLRGFGLLLIIDHGDGYMTLYGHNQSLFKEAGDWVEAGEPIAAAGSTGGRKASGVYFAIRRHGKAVNPIRWCRRVRGRRVG
jgi:septal ring factor EnvC (AmiA/AmiB activator)